MSTGLTCGVDRPGHSPKMVSALSLYSGLKTWVQKPLLLVWARARSTPCPGLGCLPCPLWVKGPQKKGPGQLCWENT